MAWQPATWCHLDFAMASARRWFFSGAAASSVCPISFQECVGGAMMQRLHLQ